ncbi:ATP12-domain-containing protein [Violaceomyces palustris]|uniref:ATP12-domain-containing protein n=1 Tax=Violaceomyces palustris TaxID=1673888 RepID=A0ACD0P6X5_9BASI|nr:ATP12-domain-containing protein [Violaceomyces palustris]
MSLRRCINCATSLAGDFTKSRTAFQRLPQQLTLSTSQFTRLPTLCPSPNRPRLFTTCIPKPSLPPQPSSKEPATSKAERTLKRFWKKVSVKFNPPSAEVQPHYTVLLDNRPLKTPGGSILRVPHDRPLLASLISHEWNEAKVLKPHTLPFTSLTARAIDGLTLEEDRKKVCSDLLKYFQTDTICFHEDHPPALVRLQKERWDPLLDWIRNEFKVQVKTFQDLLGNNQTLETLEVFSKHLSNLHPIDLAAFERGVLTTKSFMIPVALLSGHLTVEQAAQAAEVEVASQIERWGEVEDSHDVDHADLRRQLGSVSCASKVGKSGTVV